MFSKWDNSLGILFLFFLITLESGRIGPHFSLISFLSLPPFPSHLFSPLFFLISLPLLSHHILSSLSPHSLSPLSISPSFLFSLFVSPPSPHPPPPPPLSLQCEDGAAMDGGGCLQDHLLCDKWKPVPVLGVRFCADLNRRGHSAPGALLWPGQTHQAGLNTHVDTATRPTNTTCRNVQGTKETDGFELDLNQFYYCLLLF